MFFELLPKHIIIVVGAVDFDEKSNHLLEINAHGNTIDILIENRMPNRFWRLVFSTCYILFEKVIWFERKCRT